MRGAPGSTLGQRLAALEQREPPAGAGARARCVRAALELLARQAGVTAGTRVVAGYVPGRVELFGKHTDYTGGSSLLAALDRGIAYAACVGSGPIRVVSATEPEAVTLSVGNPVSHVSAPAWGTYVATVVRRLQRNFPAAIGILQGRVALAGDLPPSAGMSSSSALMIALFLALCDLAGVLQPARWPREISTPWGLAHYLACIENGQSYGPLHGEAGVGTFGGSEDHTAILCCRAGRVAQVRFAPTTLVAELPWPDWRLWLGYSGVPAEKTRAARARFNALAIQARQAHTALAAHGYGGEHLAHSVAGLREEAGTDGALNLLCVRLTDAVLCRRAEHLLREEFHYLPAAAAALQDGDLERFGAVAEASHEASRRLLGNIHPAVDALAAAARRERGGSREQRDGAGGIGLWRRLRGQRLCREPRPWGRAVWRALARRLLCRVGAAGGGTGIPLGVCRRGAGLVGGAAGTLGRQTVRRRSLSLPARCASCALRRDPTEFKPAACYSARMIRDAGSDLRRRGHR